MNDEIEKRKHITDILVKKYRWGELDIELGFESDFRCVYCGKDFLSSVDNYNEWQKDHIIPQSKGGDKENKDNLVASCKTCNFIKGKYSPKEGSRVDMLADAMKYIQNKRAEKQKEINEMRLLILRNNL